MKKIIAAALIAATMVPLTGCDDFLDNNRYPETTIVLSPDYWTNENCQLQVNRYIDELNPAYGTTQNGWFYFQTLNDDQVGSSFADWPNTTVPASDADWTYTNIRGANYIIAGAGQSKQLTESQRGNYVGIARLIRAVSYYKLVRMFGDCVWESEVVYPEDEDILYGPRTSRDVVMDSVFADLDYAINHITTTNDKVSYSRDMAVAYKSEIALYEGTFCKYRTQADNGIAPNMERANKYLNESATASLDLINCGRYSFSDDYQAIYNSVWGGMDGVDGVKIPDFNKNTEIIWGRHYDKDNGRHSLISFTCSSTTTSGMSLDAFKSYLFLDGKPAASTSYNTSLVGEPTEFDGKAAYSIAKVLENRDKRLSITTDPYVYYMGMTWARAGATGMNSSSGLGVAKYDNIHLPVGARNMSSNNYTSAPIFWLSYIYCNYAEAKAELGTLSDADMNLTINKLYKRAGLPEQTVAGLSAINDPANNMGVSSLLWEIRRNRRCELMFDNYIRYWDLVRWHQLELLDSQKHPDVMRGAYIANAPVQPGDAQDGYVRPFAGRNRLYEAKYYLRPIPSGQIDLNKNLGQNPGWE